MKIAYITLGTRCQTVEFEELRIVGDIVYIKGKDGSRWQVHESNVTIKETTATSKVDRCVICGAIIPEGRMACPNCEK